jgi:putative two-component system response regulator
MNNNPDFKDIPVIFVTSHATEKLVKKAVEHGAVDYVVKPFDASVLRTKIEGILKVKC